MLKLVKGEEYSLKALGNMIRERAAARGLTLAEEAVETLAIAAYEGTKDWGMQSAVLSDNKVDDFIAPFYGQLDGFVIPQIQKIDLDGDGK